MKNEEAKEKVTKKGSTTKGKETKKGSSTTNKQANKTTTKKKNDDKKVVAKKKVEKEIVEENIDEEVVMEENTYEVSEVKVVKKASRKGDIFLILGLVLVVVLGFVLMNGEKYVPDYELPLTLSGEIGLHQLTYQEYQEKVDNDESFVVIIERATCSHCVTFMPIAEAFATDNGLPMYYVDTDTFTAEDWEEFEDSNTFFREKGQKWGTPTTVVLAGRDAVDYIEGTTSAEKLLELYNKYFDMKEE